MATSTSTTSAATARCCSATATRRSSRRSSARRARHPSRHQPRGRRSSGASRSRRSCRRRAAGMVKFTSSGTEATMMAMRIARAYTGKDVICKMHGRFHGWHDYATMAMQPPYDEPIAPACRRRCRRHRSSACQPRDIAALHALLDSRDDIAAVILIADQAGTEYLQAVRDLCTAARVIADLRRGRYRLPLRPRRRAGILWRHARHDDACQDSRRWAERRRDRRPRRSSTASSRATTRSGAPPAHPASRYLQRQPAVGGGRHRLPGDRERSGGPARRIATADATPSRLHRSLRAARRRRQGRWPRFVGPISFAEPKIPMGKLLHRFKAAMQLGGVDPSGMS